MNNNGCVWVWVWVQTLVSCPPGGWSHLLLHFKHRPKVKKKRKRKANDPWYFFLNSRLFFSPYLQIVQSWDIDTPWEASWTLKWWTCRKCWTLREFRTLRSGWKLPLLWSGVQEEWPFYMVSLLLWSGGQERTFSGKTFPRWPLCSFSNGGFCRLSNQYYPNQQNQSYLSS